MPGPTTPERQTPAHGRVLVACEYSGRVRDAFAELGWDAWSCDLLPTDAPGQHYIGDVRDLLDQQWDVLIAFPPCTYLCSSGMHWTTRGLRDPQLTEDALAFVRMFLEADVPHIAVENPVGCISSRIRKPDCMIQPWQFGTPESKATCLWLKNLPVLQPTQICQKPASGRWENQTPSGQNKLGPSPDRWKERSKTYPGIARAMAQQWSEFVLSLRTSAMTAPTAENPSAQLAATTTPTALALAHTTPRKKAGNLSKSTEPSMPNAHVNETIESHHTTPPMTSQLSGSHNAHARLSPSAAKQWSNCTASIEYIEANRHRIPPENDRYSSEGTEAHEWAARVLLEEIAIESVPENFRPHVAAYVNHCLSDVPEGVTPMIETEVPLWYQPDQSGTCDFAWVTDAKVVIKDLKYGVGVLNPAEDNPQLAIYAYSFIHAFADIYNFQPDTEVQMGIFQPRHRDADDAKPWTLTLRDLQLFCEDIEKSIADIRSGNTEFKPSGGDTGACRWCKARTFCHYKGKNTTDPLEEGSQKFLGMSADDMLAAMPDLSKKELTAFAKENPDIPEAEVKVAARMDKLVPGVRLDDEFLVALYAASASITKFLADVEEGLSQRVLSGEQIPGTKVVMGREGNRAWANEDAADTFLRGQGLKEADRYDQKLKGPAAVEKILAEKLETSKRTANRFNELITRNPAKPVLAHVSDKRPAVGAACESMPMLDDDNL